ncbi:butanoate--CoA ligase AAE1-like [Rutidosis leptorrhynchoides]|uniref:butanoate--CoA ligase AAE1-like n=1 Tax=Rutidosis leptorrhynchoides TaxID=125765 RepID=UPI003A9908A6
MTLALLNSDRVCLHLNRNPNQATTISGNRILKKSLNSRVDLRSSTCTMHYSNIRCASSLQVSHLTGSKEEVDGITWREMEGTGDCSSNYVPLSPISFLERAAQVYRNYTSVIYGAYKYTWEETHIRCVKLASALNQLGIRRGDIVATLGPNIPAMLELHFAIPMAGGIICPLNRRLDANMLSTLLKHSEAKILFVDYQLIQVVKQALNLLNQTNSKSPLIVTISEPNFLSQINHIRKYDYDTLIDTGDASFNVIRPNNECDPISLNYTSGTTSSPKGVVYSHRGAYLNAITSVFIHGMKERSTFLWSLPMFHCNGWCFTWGVAIVGGANVCIRRFDVQDVYDSILVNKVTHMCGAPTVLNMLANSFATNDRKLPHTVEIMTGGAPPPPSIISKIEKVGFRVSHIYGLTETYGPGTFSLWQPEWDFLSYEERMRLKARQGVKHLAMEEVDVVDPVTMKCVECDGESVGEVMFRGNTVMSGYFKDPKATKEAFAGGWFHTGDLAIKHSDGYIEIKDRYKDIIISGGENICTIEVESVIYSHPAVLEVAVVARPHEHWGQTPCAFVKLKDGFCVDEKEIIKYCRDRMPHFMAPTTVIFQDLPRNSTGKVQKFLLRDKAKSL